jgi:hypothetical protein
MLEITNHGSNRGKEIAECQIKRAQPGSRKFSPYLLSGGLLENRLPFREAPRARAQGDVRGSTGGESASTEESESIGASQARRFKSLRKEALDRRRRIRMSYPVA